MRKTVLIMISAVLLFPAAACAYQDAPVKTHEPGPESTSSAAAETVSGDNIISRIMSVGTAQAFTDEAVAEEDIKTILQAGLAAESALNKQPWFFAAVTDREVMEQIAGSGSPGGKAGLGDTPLAIIVYMDESTPSPNPSFDCGLAVQNMYLAASALGYGVKIVSSPAMTLNGKDHDRICETLGADPSLTALAVLLVGKTEASADAVSGASTRADTEEKTSRIK